MAPLPHQVESWWALPSTLRIPGADSGQFIQGRNGVSTPFTDGQPLPGFSGLVPLGEGRFIGLPDNGYGSKANSSDFRLGLARLAPALDDMGSDLPRGPRRLKVESYAYLQDPRGLLGNGQGLDLVIVADLPTYRAGPSFGTDRGLPVPAELRSKRLLTGFDFDVESVALAPDGTLWLGEEFGPWLLHVSPSGELLQEPVAHPSYISPSNPIALHEPARANLGSSRGFEALCFKPEGRHLLVLPESVPTRADLRPRPDDERVLALEEFDTFSATYTGKQWLYPKEGKAVGNEVVVADIACVGATRYLVLERDHFGGDAAKHKRVYLVDLLEQDSAGLLKKRLVLDLLSLSDPRRAASSTGTFSFPFLCVESVAFLAPDRIFIANDSNYPGDDNRVRGRPDDSEIAEIRMLVDLRTLPLDAEDRAAVH